MCEHHQHFDSWWLYAKTYAIIKTTIHFLHKLINYFSETPGEKFIQVLGRRKIYILHPQKNLYTALTQEKIILTFWFLEKKKKSSTPWIASQSGVLKAQSVSQSYQSNELFLKFTQILEVSGMLRERSCYDSINCCLLHVNISHNFERLMNFNKWHEQSVYVVLLNYILCLGFTRVCGSLLKLEFTSLSGCQEPEAWTAKGPGLPEYRPQVICTCTGSETADSKQDGPSATVAPGRTSQQKVK